MARKPKSRPLQAAPVADIIKIDFSPSGKRAPASVVQRILTKIARPSGKHGCRLWTGSIAPSTGYPQHHARVDGVTVGYKPARVLWEEKLGRKLQRHEQVCHKPGVCSQDPACMHLDHHYVGDAKQNMADKKLSGRHRSFRLIEPQVHDIVAALKAGDTLMALAEVYGVHVTTINSIRRGKTWSKITGIVFAPKPNGRPRKAAIAPTAKRATQHQGAVA